MDLTPKTVKARTLEVLIATARHLHPLIARSGALPFARRLVRGPPTSLRLHASLLLDPPGSTGTAAVSFDGGQMLVNPGEDIGRALAYGFREFEPFEQLLFTRLVRPDDVVIDVGANYGLYSILAARRVGTGGQVHAFEPNPFVCELLQRNLEPFAGRVHVNAVAVGEKPGRVQFRCTLDTAYSGVIDTGRSAVGACIDVERVSLDAFAASHALAHVDIVKVDVEGYEPEVLSGAQALLARTDAPVLLVEAASKNLSVRNLRQRDVLQRLESLGYEVRAAAAGLPVAARLSWNDGATDQENFLAVKPAHRARLGPLLAG